MAASKKKVTKDDLRRFMREKQSLSKTTEKKVNHPLAKYNSLNQLVCILCNNVIKSDLLWSAHILSKQHKEKALALKTQGPEKPEHLSHPGKRKAEILPPEDVKKKKTESSTKNSNLPKDFFDGTSKLADDNRRERAKAALLAGYSSSEDSEEDEEEEEEDNSKKPQSTSADDTLPNGLPVDFFDSGQGPSSEVKEEENRNKTMADILPEGFFDDPKMDAKVRKVEYKDKMEEEWDLFQKAMKEEAHVSEVIIEEEDEQANLDRNIDEIDDQIQRWQEVENLHVKKETVMKKSALDEQKKDDSEEEVDEEALDEFLDWRAKKSMR